MWEKCRAGNFGFAICYAIQVSLESLGVVLEEALAVDVHASRCNMFVGDFIPAARGHEWFWDVS